MNERNIVSLRSVAQRDSIGIVHKMICFITSQQPTGTVLCYKTFFYTSLQPSKTMPMIPLSYAPKTLAKFGKGQNDNNICEMHDLSFE